MDTQKSYKKPYVEPVKGSWWLSHKVYIIYTIRELTAVFSFLIAAELLVFCAAAASMKSEAQPFIESFIQHPAVIILNIISLIAVLFHTVTWFNLMPKAVRFFRSRRPEDTRMIPEKFWIILLWSLTAVASALITLVLIYA